MVVYRDLPVSFLYAALTARRSSSLWDTMSPWTTDSCTTTHTTFLLYTPWPRIENYSKKKQKNPQTVSRSSWQLIPSDWKTHIQICASHRCSSSKMTYFHRLHSLGQVKMWVLDGAHWGDIIQAILLVIQLEKNLEPQDCPISHIKKSPRICKPRLTSLVKIPPKCFSISAVTGRPLSASTWISTERWLQVTVSPCCVLCFKTFQLVTSYELEWTERKQNLCVTGRFRDLMHIPHGSLCG